MNKTEAAEFLGVSPRAVERYVSAGKLAGRYERGKTGQVLAFDETELQRFKDELNAPVARGTVADASPGARPDSERQAATQGTTTLTTARSATAPDNPDSKALARLDRPLPVDSVALVRAVYALATMADKPRQAPTVPVENKLLLKLDEAAALTGLSRATLRQAIDAKQLKAKQIGRAWRIKRADLEKYVSGL
jgi:excisionase family DNA binding protein